MAAGGHFGCPKITFDRISGHFRSLSKFNFFGNFWQNGCRRPFWMSEIHFGSHFWPFLTNTDFWFVYKMAAGGHFGCPKITFGTGTFDLISIHRISGHLDVQNSLSIAFLAISDLYATLIFLFFFTKWLPAAILDVRKSLSISFLSISHRYATFFEIFDKIRHFWPFQIDTQL